MVILLSQNQDKVVKTDMVFLDGSSILVFKDGSYHLFARYSTNAKAKRVFEILLSFIGGQYDYEKNGLFTNGCYFRLPKESEV